MKKGVVLKSREKILENIEIVDDYAERIRNARIAMGLSREILAQMLKEKESTLRRIELGDLIPSIPLARKIEKILKITLIEEVNITTGEYKSSSLELTLGDIAKIKRRSE